MQIWGAIRVAGDANSVSPSSLKQTAGGFSQQRTCQRSRRRGFSLIIAASRRFLRPPQRHWPGPPISDQFPSLLQSFNSDDRWLKYFYLFPFSALMQHMVFHQLDLNYTPQCHGRHWRHFFVHTTALEFHSRRLLWPQRLFIYCYHSFPSRKLDSGYFGYEQTKVQIHNTDTDNFISPTRLD